MFRPRDRRSKEEREALKKQNEQRKQALEDAASADAAEQARQKAIKDRGSSNRGRPRQRGGQGRGQRGGTEIPEAARPELRQEGIGHAEAESRARGRGARARAARTRASQRGGRARGAATTASATPRTDKSTLDADSSYEESDDDDLPQLPQPKILQTSGLVRVSDSDRHKSRRMMNVEDYGYCSDECNDPEVKERMEGEDEESRAIRKHPLAPFLLKGKPQKDHKREIDVGASFSAPVNQEKAKEKIEQRSQERNMDKGKGKAISVDDDVASDENDVSKGNLPSSIPADPEDIHFLDNRERREDAIQNQDRDWILKEFGTTHEKGKPNPLDGKVYLIQMPPILPDLYKPKSFPGREEHPSFAGGATHQNSDRSDDTITASKPRPPPHLEPGWAGKFNVHKSGKVSITWGDTHMQLSKGIDVECPSLVVDMQLPEQEDEVGEACAFGSIVANLVVTPDFEKIFDLEEARRAKSWES